MRLQIPEVPDISLLSPRGRFKCKAPSLCPPTARGSYAFSRDHMSAQPREKYPEKSSWIQAGGLRAREARCSQTTSCRPEGSQLSQSGLIRPIPSPHYAMQLQGKRKLHGLTRPYGWGA